MDKFFLTTPIYYVNARPHIGHAYTTIVADVLARRARAQGIETFFLTGTDEHGQKIERSASAAGVPPQQFTDEVSAAFSTLWQRMGITHDTFIRTTSAEHKRGVQKLFQTLQDNGKIELRSYTGSYCVSDEAFVDLPAGTPCPDCGRPLETVTEQNYFFKLSEYQLPLINLIESGQLSIQPESRRNEVLSFLRGPVHSHTSAKSEDLGAPRLASETWDGSAQPSNSPGLAHSALGTPYLPGALKDLSISRTSFKWGIPVPNDEDHVIYVWLDALANYMTALGYGSEDDSLWQKFWPADLHIVGKEIIRFHCVYWPAFLLAANLPLPKQVVAHGWLLFEESKMSKSKGNIVRTETILDAFGTLCPPPPTGDGGTPQTPGTAVSPTEYVFADENRKGTPSGVPQTPPVEKVRGPSGPSKHHQDLFAADVLRYFLLREIPFGQDGSFSFDALITRYNADLANGYGNLVSRVLNMISQYLGGEIPNLDTSREYATNEAERERFASETAFGRSNPESMWRASATKATEEFDIYQVTARSIAIAGNASHNLQPNLILGEIGICVAVTDSFLSDHTPWKLSKSTNPVDQKRLIEVLAAAAESIRIITALLYPILPYATASVWRQLGLGDIEQAAANGELKNLEWGGLQPGTKLGPLSPIFPRADKGLAQIMTDMENPAPAPSEQIACVTGPNDPPSARLSAITEQHDATHPATDDLPTTPLASESAIQSRAPFIAPTPMAPESHSHAMSGSAQTSTSPEAAPRTSTLAEPNPGSHVGASAATTTERPGTPPHTEAHASGIFASQPADSSPQITIDDFAKVELRVAQVVVAERIPKADKLLRLEVDLGYEKRQILSGIAEWYTPEELIGRRIVVITNLAPRKMRGLESHGMLLAASTEGGKPHLATFTEAETLPLGSRLK